MINQVIISGLLLGGVYAQFTIGLTLIFGVMDIPNFAHGEFLMLGMYATFGLWKFLGMDPYLSILIVAPLLFFFGMVIEKVFIERILDRPILARLIVMLGLSIIFLNSGLIGFAPITRVISTPYRYKFIPLPGNVIISLIWLITFGLCVLFTMLLFLFLKKTKTGLAIQSTMQNLEAAQLVGIDVKWVYRVAFGIGIGLCGVAGPCLAIIFPISPNTGQEYTLLAFVIAVLAGLGNIRNAIFAGLFLGVVNALVGTYLDVALAPAIYFFLFIVMIILRALKEKG